MTVGELMKELEDYHPDTEVVVSNAAIYFLSEEPGYYDGAFTQLIQDHSKDPYYNIVGARYVRTGSKVQIHTMNVRDVLLDDHEAPVEFEGFSNGGDVYYRQRVESTREELRRDSQDHENRWFEKYLLQRLGTWLNDDFDEEHVKEVARDFAERELLYSLPTPKWVPLEGTSYVDRRRIQWDREVKVSVGEGRLILERIPCEETVV